VDAGFGDWAGIAGLSSRPWEGCQSSRPASVGFE
jgi:hypothetical protein